MNVFDDWWDDAIQSVVFFSIVEQIIEIDFLCFPVFCGFFFICWHRVADFVASFHEAEMVVVESIDQSFVWDFVDVLLG